MLVRYIQAYVLGVLSSVWFSGARMQFITRHEFGPILHEGCSKSLSFWQWIALGADIFHVSDNIFSKQTKIKLFCQIVQNLKANKFEYLYCNGKKINFVF